MEQLIEIIQSAIVIMISLSNVHTQVFQFEVFFISLMPY